MSFVIIALVIVAIFILVSKMNSRGFEQVNVERAKALIKDSAIKILDVRTPQEFGQGHIKGAQLVPVSDIHGRIQELAPLKDQQILVYCHAGSRSATACRVLRKSGFTKVRNLQGGIRLWTGSGNKVVKGS